MLRDAASGRSFATECESFPILTPRLPPAIRWQYYDDTYETTKEQRAFEKKLFQKTHRANCTPQPMPIFHT